MKFLVEHNPKQWAFVPITNKYGSIYSSWLLYWIKTIYLYLLPQPISSSTSLYIFSTLYMNQIQNYSTTTRDLISLNPP